MEAEYFNLYLHILLLSQISAWKIRKGTENCCVMIDCNVMEAADIMTITLLLNEGGMFVL